MEANVFGCYNQEDNTCDLSCQGCCDCIRAEYLKGIRKHEPRIGTMLKYMKESIKQQKENDEILDKIIADMKETGELNEWRKKFNE